MMIIERNCTHFQWSHKKTSFTEVSHLNKELKKKEEKKGTVVVVNVYRGGGEDTYFRLYSNKSLQEQVIYNSLPDNSSIQGQCTVTPINEDALLNYTISVFEIKVLFCAPSGRTGS